MAVPTQAGISKMFCVKCGAMILAEFNSNKQRMELNHPRIYGCPLSLRSFVPPVFDLIEETDE